MNTVPVQSTLPNWNMESLGPTVLEGGERGRAGRGQNLGVSDVSVVSSSPASPRVVVNLRLRVFGAQVKVDVGLDSVPGRIDVP